MSNDKGSLVSLDDLRAAETCEGASINNMMDIESLEIPTSYELIIEVYRSGKSRDNVDLSPTRKSI